MTGEIFQPQMTQMNADVFLKLLICGNLRNLQLTKALKGNLVKIGV